MSEGAASRDVRTHIRHRLYLLIPLAHLTGAAFAVASGALTDANIRGQQANGLEDVILPAVYLGITLPLGGWLFERASKRSTRWLVEDRAPSEAEQRSTLALPWYMAAGSMCFWVGAAVVWSLLASTTHNPGYAVRVALSILLGGLTACGLTYLLVEWTGRPLTALALAGHVPERSLGAGVRTKLLVSWAIGADVFLLMIGLSFVGRPTGKPPSAAAIWFIIGAGLIAGTMVLYVATRSLVSPLLELRQAVGRVQRGQIDVKVTVNDGGSWDSYRPASTRWCWACASAARSRTSSAATSGKMWPTKPWSRGGSRSEANGARSASSSSTSSARPTWPRAARPRRWSSCSTTSSPPWSASWRPKVGGSTNSRVTEPSVCSGPRWPKRIVRCGRCGRPGSCAGNYSSWRLPTRSSMRPSGSRRGRWWSGTLATSTATSTR